MTNESVVRLLAEGGCFEVFGRKTADGKWLFSGRAITMGEDAEEWHGASTPESSDLADFIPTIWPRLTPRLVHPELRQWFQERFDDAASPEHRRASWLALFASTPPDRWSESE